jgi:hypothetical protein
MSPYSLQPLVVEIWGLFLGILTIAVPLLCVILL